MSWGILFNSLFYDNGLIKENYTLIKRELTKNVYGKHKMCMKLIIQSQIDPVKVQFSVILFLIRVIYQHKTKVEIKTLQGVYVFMFCQ